MRKRPTALFLCACTCFSLLACDKNAFTQEDELPSFVIGGAMHDPYFYTDKNGEYSGVDVAIAKEACARMGYAC